MDYTRFLRELLHDYWLGKQAFVVPATLYVGLFTTATDIDGGGTEVTGGAYARVAVTNNNTNWPDADTNGDKSNGAIIQFPTPTASWGTITHFALLDAATAGNMFAQAALTVSKAINIDDDVEFPIGDIDSNLV